MNFASRRLARTAAMLVAVGSIIRAAGDGNLALTVTDATGKPVAGATVVISSPTQIAGARTLATDAAGKVRFARLSPGAFKVIVTAGGFQSLSLDNVEVTVDQTAQVNARLAAVNAATVEVIAAVSTVDTTTITQGTTVTSEQLESLPVGRTQLASINLAPGVISMGPTMDPALTTGLNRSNTGAMGARNNTYLIDGIDVTSPESGTLRTGVAPELIQVQDVKTGAITAEYSARAGLFSSVTTKSGGNEFSGGLTLDQNPGSLQANPAPDRFQVGDHNVTDYTLWFMGPILKDKLWFVTSYQGIKNTVGVTLDPSATTTPGEKRTGINNQGYGLFAKLTYQPTQNDTLDLTFNKNPFKSDNLVSPSVLTRRALRTDQGGQRYLFHYGHQFSNLFVDVRTSRHEERNWNFGEYTDVGPQNTIRSLSALTPLQSQLGNNGTLDKRDYQKDLTRLDLTYMFDAMGSHVLKAGAQVGKEQLTQGIGILQTDQFESYDVGTYRWSNLPAGNVKSQKVRILNAINNTPSLKAAFIAAGYIPTGTGGTFGTTDLDNYQFSEANPFGGYYAYRIHQQDFAESTPKLKTNGFYMQDQWQINRLTLSPGLRFDSYKFLADNGAELFNTKYTVAPRMGLTYDVLGGGRSKVYAYFGRYIDPIKLDMVRFTGSLTSSVRTEDARMLNQWITYNVRGGSKTVDAVFADTFKLPKTDEFRIGYSFEFGKNYSLDASFTRRRDYDIVEDWDPTLYTNPLALEDEARGNFGMPTRASGTPLTAQQQQMVNLYRNLAIDPSYFAGGGYTGDQNVARVQGRTLNFVLANLPGGERVFRSLDLTVNRREANHWGGLLTLSLVQAKGNSNSSGNADFQGDLAKYDPRLPYTNGYLEGSVNWVMKSYGYYRWDNGLLVGLNFVSHSGFHYSRGDVGSGRVLQATPSLSEAFSEQLGTRMTPVYNQWDMRIQYGHKLTEKVRGEVYLDVINVMNRQEATGLSEGLNVRSGIAGNTNAALPDQPYSFQAPRQLSFGVRLKF